MNTRILPTHTPTLFAAAVQHAAELLHAGEVVALPTETVYGLAANAFDPKAVARLFEVKGRPAYNPIIVHVAGLELARRCVRDWPESAAKLAAAFWPGPLTLVLPRSPDIPDLVTAGGDTVGVRWPAHLLMQAVIRACGFPLAAPSANLAGALSPTSAAHVRQGLGGRIPLIVDGGPSPVGIESVVLDLCVRPPRVLRPGMIHEESLVAVIGEVSGAGNEASGGGALRSPGLLKRHYAPQAKLVVLVWQDEEDLKFQISNLKFQIQRTHVIAHTRVPPGGGFGGVSVIPRDAEEFARAIYAELHRCDERQPALIVVEALPDEPEWRAIVDRLARASA